MYCSMGVKITNIDPFVGEVSEIAIIPLDDHFEINPLTLPFSAFVHTDAEKCEPGNVIGLSHILATATQVKFSNDFGSERGLVRARLISWAERLTKSKIVPVCVNYPNVMAHVIKLLGSQTYWSIFDISYLDPIPCIVESLQGQKKTRKTYRSMVKVADPTPRIKIDAMSIAANTPAIQTHYRFMEE